MNDKYNIYSNNGITIKINIVAGTIPYSVFLLSKKYSIVLFLHKDLIRVYDSKNEFSQLFDLNIKAETALSWFAQIENVKDEYNINKIVYCDNKSIDQGIDRLRKMIIFS